MIFEKTLPNGLELIVQRTSAPVAAIQVWVDVGSIDEKPQEAGFCHFLEHMLFKGTAKRTTAEIAGSVEGAGGEMNAFTSFEYTVYHITLSNQRWKLANDILSDMVLGSAFYPKEFNPEKEVILEEIKRGEDSSDRSLYRGVYANMYGTAGYGRPVIGFPKTVKACTASTLKAFWKKWYAPSLITVVVAGDVDPIEVEREVMKTWGKAKAKALRPRRRETGFDQKIAPLKKLTGGKEFPVNAIRWAAALPACSIQAAILPALDASGMILGQGESSRLYRRLFREEQVVTSFSAGVWSPAGTGMYSFDAEVPVEKAGKFRSILREEIERFCEEGPTEEELDRVKVAIETDRIYSAQAMDGLANRLGFQKTVLGNTHFDLEYLMSVRDLTLEDVRLAAKQFLNLSELREYALYPKKFDPTAIWPKTETISRSKPSVKKRVAPTEASKTGERIVLNNGIELVLYPRKDVPVISMQACAFGGVRFEQKSNAGIGNLLTDVWEKGPHGWSATRFSEFLEGRGARIEAFSGRNSLGLSAGMLTSRFAEVAPVFAETLFNPALEESEFEHSRNVTLEDIRTVEDDSGRLVGRMFCENLFEGHPYAFPLIGYNESVRGTNHGDLLRHYKELIQHSPLVISVSGKFDSKKVIEIFEKIKRSNIGKASSKTLNWQGPKAPRVAEVKKNREQSHLVMGFRGTSVGTQDSYVLRVLLTVLSGQSGRLFTELRDKQGLCYTVAPISFEGIEPGYVGVYMGCDPTKRAAALKGIRSELDRIAQKSISSVELKRAKEFILGRHHMDMQMNGAIASASAFNTLYGIGFDEHLKLAERLKPIDVKAVRVLAERIFGSPSVTAIVV